MNELLLSKLKKLLNLSKSSNSNEAELALSKAHKLAVEAGIDLAVVEARGENPVEKLEMVGEKLDCGQRLPSTQKYASWLLNKHFGVQVIYSGGRAYGRTIQILGDKKDVEFALFVNEFVQDDMQRRWEYYKKTNSLSVRLKQTFLYNCWRGLDAKLTEVKAAAEQEKFNEIQSQEQRETVQNKYGLILLNKKEVVDNYVKSRFPFLSHAKTRINALSSGSVASDAFSIGKSMSINRPLPA